MLSLGREPRDRARKRKKSRGAATDIFGQDRGSSQVQRQVSGTASRYRNQEQRQISGATVRLREAVVVTSGSVKRGSSRWPADVKGRPVQPVRSTLDIGWLTGLWGRI
jgi:hypothetical protein